MNILVSTSLARYARDDVVFWLHDESPENGTLDADIASGTIVSVGRGAHGTEYTVLMLEPEKKKVVIRESALYRTRTEVLNKFSAFKKRSVLASSKP